MKTYFFTFCFFLSLVSSAQTAHIVLKLPQNNDFIVSLTTEKIRHIEAPSIGLTDVEFLNIGTVDDSTKRWAMTEMELKEPQLVRVNITNRRLVIGYKSQGSANRLLFISPNDSLTIMVNPDKTLAFSGRNAAYQEYLRDYFRENMYEYLPQFGYNPSQIDNSQILGKVDSLQRARQQGFQKLKGQYPVSEAFETYVAAVTNTEPYLLKLVVSDKKVRGSQGIQLKPDQRKEIQDLTLQNFKLLPDAALLSEAYRNELRNYIQIPVIQKYPSDSAKRYVLSPEAVQLAYQLSDEKLKDYPKQREYLLTHWLDYSITFRSDMKAARNLLAKYEQTYPASALNSYFKRTIAAKERMEAAQSAPEFMLKDRTGKTVTLSSLRGKPVCIAFCFNLKQHEYIFKPLEEKYRDRLTFVYLNVTPATPYELWQPTTENRPGVLHLWASDKDAQKIKDTYASTMRYPFVLIDSQGKIVERWIPQEFPDNKTLQAELSGLVRK
ncbi:alkyl hydroperoxide reductase/ Thiol specific antioxidant/ Mal allergen [Runella slithyformis DSM 19594]|uniref:Alkyl hydroperoxide reductase/ Thiol specific antioxidant/ Mal allergen n=1 Tax=Runella slithyformis (strain ATCC 29530 / DSM 19594 / LMG 11500 / NCIMB 11436 / LSU 4) TaxID=761193 RepID=A0A7U3ZGC9_RUNSL|nr:alkyl hydroperoxide reductase/ Thiol specific antioxidant/ Mal allergen [Runella slithyformis DSM 19594]